MDIWRISLSVWALGAIAFRLRLEMELSENDEELVFAGHLVAAAWSAFWPIALIFIWLAPGDD